MIRPLLLLALALAPIACGSDDGGAGDSTLPAADTSADTTDTLTAVQQRDRTRRAVSESQLPGAGVLGRAMDASEAAEARAAAMDSATE